MKKLLFLLSVIVGLTLIFGCDAKELKNQWVDQPIAIDGDCKDWESFELQFFEEENLMMGSLNDAENIYIMFRYTDQQLARKIQRMGVTVWLDREGKKQKNYGIKYNGSIELHSSFGPKVSTSEQNSRNKMDRRERMKNFMDRLGTHSPGPGKIWFIEGKEKTELPENQTSGASAGSANHNGIYCYEFRIPIPIGIKENNKINLCMELGGISSEELSEMRKQRGGSEGMRGMGGGRPPGSMGEGRSGSMGRGRGMGRPGSRGPGGPGSMEKALEKKDIWMKILIAKKIW